ncbi:MAG: M48 family metallopeptidase [Rikenellaceae bacterium]|nr:M48 family metallopeptidase [Rikenellaceae bacterium]
MKKNFIPLLLILFVGGFYGCTAVTAVTATSAGVKLLQAATISDSYVQEMSSEYVKQLDAQSQIAPADNPYAIRLDRLTRPFNNQNGINIKVYLTPEANAFATADGSVRVYSGLMDIMTDEELLGIIGHEIGHYMNHDTRDAFKNALVSSAVREGLSSTSGVIGTLSSSQIGAIGESYSNSRFSRKQESEADDYGYEFLVSHGINPWAMVMAFEKLQQLENTSGSASSLQKLFSTHPDSGERARRMAERAAKDGYARPSNSPLTGGSGSGSSSGTASSPAASASPSSEWTF